MLNHNFFWILFAANSLPSHIRFLMRFFIRISFSPVSHNTKRYASFEFFKFIPMLSPKTSIFITASVRSGSIRWWNLDNLICEMGTFIRMETDNYELIRTIRKQTYRWNFKNLFQKLEMCIRIVSSFLVEFMRFQLIQLVNKFFHLQNRTNHYMMPHLAMKSWTFGVLSFHFVCFCNCDNFWFLFVYFSSWLLKIIEIKCFWLVFVLNFAWTVQCYLMALMLHSIFCCISLSFISLHNFCCENWNFVCHYHYWTI